MNDRYCAMDCRHLDNRKNKSKNDKAPLIQLFFGIQFPNNKARFLSSIEFERIWEGRSHINYYDSPSAPAGWIRFYTMDMKTYQNREDYNV